MRSRKIPEILGPYLNFLCYKKVFDTKKTHFSTFLDCEFIEN